MVIGDVYTLSTEKGKTQLAGIILENHRALGDKSYKGQYARWKQMVPLTTGNGEELEIPIAW